MSARARSMVAFVAAALTLAACGERPPIESVQRGYRGTGMQELHNPRLVTTKDYDLNRPPAPQPPAPEGGPPATQVFQNVQVLKDLSVNEFTRFMVAITQWVSPDQGCNYCHVPGNLASDDIYTKIVSRRMIEMTRSINANYQNHVGQTGVTCYTCHRGAPVPGNIWFADPGPVGAKGVAGNRAGQNAPAAVVNLTSLPFDPFTPFITQAKDVRVIGGTALPSGNRHSIKETEWTYAYMIHFSQALGVNCTYCHNTRSFADWDASTPQRTTSWYGQRMTRDINRDYIEPLQKVFPAHRLGTLGDVAKTNCATCHNGVYKPMYGVSMLKDYPYLAKPATAGGGAPASTAPTAQADTPPPAVTAQFAIVYFAVGSANVPSDLPSALLPLVAELKGNAKAIANISGYHSASGDLAMNQELARNRAIGVQSAMASAGVPADRLRLDKPLQTEANVAGEDPRSRRVEVRLMTR